MFFFGSGSAILPYLLYLILIWGVFLVNGLVHQSLKSELHKNSKDTTSSEIHLKSSAENSNYYFEKNSEKEKSKQGIGFRNISFIRYLKPKPVTDFTDIGLRILFLHSCISFRAPPF